MAVNIVRKPYAVDFIKNDLNVVFKGDNLIADGVASKHIIYFLTPPSNNGTFTLQVNSHIFQYTIVSTQSNDIFKLLFTGGQFDGDDVLNKFNSNYYISENFEVSFHYLANIFAWIIILDAKQHGNNSVDIIESKNVNVTVVNTKGRTKIFRNDYKISAYFNLEYTEKGNIIQEKSPDILLDADENGYATLSLDILKKLGSDIDIPTSFTTQYSAFILNRILVKYAVFYMETYGKIIRDVKKSDNFFGIKGLISSTGLSVNRPDWDDGFSGNKIEKCPYIRLFGCDNSKTVISHLNGKDYLYLCLFDISKSNQFSNILKGKVELLYANGAKSELNLPDLTIKNFSIVRVPAHLRAFNSIANRENVIQFKILLFNSDKVNGKMERTFTIAQTNSGIHEFLFQNKYGVLEYFFVAKQKIEIGIKADEILLNSLKEINISEKNKTLTVNTGAKHRHQLKVLEQAAQTENNFIILKNRLCPIYIVPESITILDEDKDLQESTFKFRFKDENTEEIVLPYSSADSLEELSVWTDFVKDESNTNIAVAWNDEKKYNQLNTENLWR